MVKRCLNIVNNSFAGGVIFAYFVVNILHILGFVHIKMLTYKVMV